MKTVVVCSGSHLRNLCNLRMAVAFLVGSLERLRCTPPVQVWTVNDSADGERMLDLSVDGIITDRPDLIRRLIDRREGMSDEERAMRKVRGWLGQ